MVTMPGPDIFDYLAKQTVTGTTQENLHNSVKDTNVDRTNVRAWQDAIMIAKAIEDSRTFARGLPIYDTGKVVSAALADGANITHTPSGTEVWKLQALETDSCTVAIRDADGLMVQLNFDAGAGTTVPPSSIYLCASQSLFITNPTGSSKTPAFSYIKVSL
jgi:hypothetical protein